MIQSKYFLAVVLKAISNGISDLNAFELLALCKQVLPQNAAKRRLAILILIVPVLTPSGIYLLLKNQNHSDQD